MAVGTKARCKLRVAEDEIGLAIMRRNAAVINEAPLVEICRGQHPVSAWPVESSMTQQLRQA